MLQFMRVAVWAFYNCIIHKDEQNKLLRVFFPNTIYVKFGYCEYKISYNLWEKCKIICHWRTYPPVCQRVLIKWINKQIATGLTSSIRIGPAVLCFCQKFQNVFFCCRHIFKFVNIYIFHSSITKILNRILLFFSRYIWRVEQVVKRGSLTSVVKYIS